MIISLLFSLDWVIHLIRSIGFLFGCKKKKFFSINGLQAPI